MRIRIDIEDGRTATSVEGEDVTGITVGAAPGPQPLAPPAELAARAAAIGALSGGPAPSGPPEGFTTGAPGFQPTAPGTPSSPGREETAAGASSDLPAGAAPGAAGSVPGVEIEEGQPT
jgi:hypothetical protein